MILRFPHIHHGHAETTRPWHQEERILMRALSAKKSEHSRPNSSRAVLRHYLARSSVEVSVRIVSAVSAAEMNACTNCASVRTKANAAINLTFGRDPTLSYTERLEAKVRELQTLLQQASASCGRDEPLSSLDKGESSRGDTPASSCSERLTIDDLGRISFHGPTSIFNAPLASPSRREDVTLTACAADGDRADKRREQLVTNAWVQRAAEAIAKEEVGEVSSDLNYPSADCEKGPFPSLLQYLLDFHWTWIQPIFNFVYRPAFTRNEHPYMAF